jgi:hypothetical protein
MMGVETPMPPVAMNAAASEGAHPRRIKRWIGLFKRE